jgi:hypothetical protein
MIQLIDSIGNGDIAYRPQGIFTLNIYHKGLLIEVYQDKNLVVDLSKQQLARLIGGDVTNRSLTIMGFGTSGTAPAAGNTSLTGAYTNALGAVTYPTTNSVQYAFSLGTTEANGLSIMEFGLFTTGSVLFARKTRSGAIVKDSDLSLAGTWQINF